MFAPLRKGSHFAPLVLCIVVGFLLPGSGAVALERQVFSSRFP